MGKASATRGRREDGANTRAQILEAAGRLFAEKGFDRTTAKEIAHSAGVNAAAVNYHYGGIEGLYQEVLVEAHRRFVSLNAIDSTVARVGDPREKLRRLIELVVQKALSTQHASSWAVRVLSREFLSPTPHSEPLRRQEIGPKNSIALGLIADLLGVPREDPAVARTCFTIAAPFVMLLVADRQLITSIFPSMAVDTDADARAIADHMAEFALAGIDRIARERSGYRD
jgi:AcrR family transcriptional regulator